MCLNVCKNIVIVSLKTKFRYINSWIKQNTLEYRKNEFGTRFAHKMPHVIFQYWKKRHFIKKENSKNNSSTKIINNTDCELNYLHVFCLFVFKEMCAYFDKFMTKSAQENILLRRLTIMLPTFFIFQTCSWIYFIKTQCVNLHKTLKTFVCSHLYSCNCLVENWT